MRRTVTILAAAFFAAGIAFAQDPPTIGKAAQQAQKDKDKDTEKQKDNKDKDKEAKDKKTDDAQQQKDQRQRRDQQQPQQQPQPQPQVHKPQWQPPAQQQPQNPQPPKTTRPWPRTLPDVQKLPDQRLSRERQKELIDQQKKRNDAYDRQLDRQRLDNERRAADLRRQKRNEQYRFHEEYMRRLSEQRESLHRHHDWEVDPFFFSAPAFRYWRGGRWYHVNRYAAEALQDAVSYGYEEGYRAGAADRADGWRYDDEGSFAWQDATYGYDGFYVSDAEYAYYFRQGFRRGYEDGFYRRHRYGEEVDGGFRIFADSMRLIIDLKALD